MLAKRDDVALSALFYTREDEGWRRTVDGVLALSRASESDLSANHDDGAFDDEGRGSAART